MPLLGFAMARGRSAVHFLRTQVAAHLPLVVLLTLISVILHHKHLLDVTDGFFLRWAVQDFLADTQATTRAAPGERIQVIEASSAMRIQELEMSGAATRDIERIGGVRPMDREKLARVLVQLADLLDERAARRATVQGPAESMPKVIAIDVDVTPLGAGDATGPMVDALDRLRKHATVIALAMERPTREQRAYRNAFMVAAGCTRAAAQSTRRAAAAGVARQPLYFASPSVFPQRYGNYLTFAQSFPFEAIRGKRGNRWQPADLYFPSLSNLLHFSTGEADQPAAALNTLTLLCDQAANPPADGLLLQDIVMEVPSTACSGAGTAVDCSFDADHYTYRGTHWGLQNSDLVGWVPLASSQELRYGDSPAAEARVEALVGAGRLLISVDGGASHDKFSVPSFSHVPVSGAMVQALQALSARPGKNLNSESAKGLLVDFAMGIVFLIAWRPLRRIGLMLPEALKPIFHAAGPVLVAVFAAKCFIDLLAPRLIAEGIWVNPAYVLAGLVLHAYVEGMDPPDSHPHSPDLSFGAVRMLDAFRTGNVERIGIAIAAAVQWAVLLWGGWYVAFLDHGGIVLAVLAAIIVAGAIVRHLRGVFHDAPSLQHP